MRIIITGASGNYGRAAVAGLLEKVPPRDLILITRSPARLSEFAALGAEVRPGDFDDPASLRAAFSGGDIMLLISTNRVGKRIPQHRAAIEAAVSAGVKRIVYTSFVGLGPDNPALVNRDHWATEQMLQASGVHWTALRDSQYADAIVEAVAPMALATGVWKASAGAGKVAFVTRRDCVACAVAVLTSPGHEDRVYNITGPELLSFGDAAAILAEVAGRPVEYHQVTADEMYATFDALGIPREAQDDQMIRGFAWSSDDMVSFETALRSGYFEVLSDDVERLLGRRPQSFRSFAEEHADMLRAAATRQETDT
ncbi:MAG: SDR family oxidoreductase [Spongiibacteraceae bacterium]|jgi:NAD(P)H dehydrogenase (quinone)|nr:SDR family oxidoreductase [Spongiibacteraceae bacterium]